MEVLYTTSAFYSGSNMGIAKTEDDVLCLQLKAPKELGGPGSEFTNPEQLFAMGYASCFGMALHSVAAKNQKSIEQMITVKLHTGKREEGGYQFETELTVCLSGVNQDEANALVEEAKQLCPYSNAIVGNVKETIRVSLV